MDAVGSGPVGEAIALATSSHFGVGNSHFHYARGERWVDTVYLGAWPREVFTRIGPFDPEMVRNQDDEFNYRLASAGGRVLLTDRIRSRYYSRASMRTVFRQYRQYGTWKVRVLQKHPRQMRPRQFVPPVFVAVLGTGMLLAPFSRVLRRLWLGTLGSYGLAALAASVSTARRAGWRHLLVLPAVFAALHVGYGAGFLVGLVRFRRRWRDQG
jgi:succinoglycan biosynthesis protein ExoA